MLIQDPWVLQIVQDLWLPLVAQPIQVSAPPQMQLPQEQQASVSTEIQTMIGKQAISVVQSVEEGFISQIFLVLKKDSGHWPAVNLKALNKFVAEEHFRMEDFHMMKDLVKPADWLTKLDLKDAYFLVRTSKPYLPDVSPVSVAGSNIPVPLPSVWPIMCIPYIDKTNKASSSFSEGEKNQIDCIPG